MGEPLHLEPGPGAGLGLDRTQAVEHEQRRLMGQDLPADEGRDPLESLVLKSLEGAEIGHPVGDEGRIEEPHRAQMRQHAAVALAEDGDEEGAVSLHRTAVDDLAGQDGLAYARQSLDQVKAAVQESAAKDLVETRHKTLDPSNLLLASIRLIRHALSDPVPGAREEA